MSVLQGFNVQEFSRIYKTRVVLPARPRSAPLWVPMLPSPWSQSSAVSLSLQSACIPAVVSLHVADMQRMFTGQRLLLCPTAADTGEFSQVVEQRKRLADQHARSTWRMEPVSSGASTAEVQAPENLQRRVVTAADEAVTHLVLILRKCMHAGNQGSCREYGAPWGPIHRAAQLLRCGSPGRRACTPGPCVREPLAIAARPSTYLRPADQKLLLGVDQLRGDAYRRTLQLTC